MVRLVIGCPMGKSLPNISVKQPPVGDLYRMYDEVLRLRREVESLEAKAPPSPVQQQPKRKQRILQRRSGWRCA